MFASSKRTFLILCRTPLIPPPPGPQVLELQNLTSSTRSGPSRPRAASRTFSSISVKSIYGGREETRRYASDFGKKELYSDEAGSTGAGTDDVAHTDAAFNSDPNPETATKDVQKETGKDFTKKSPADPAYSHAPGKPGDGQNEKPQLTSNSEKKKAEGK